MNDQRSLNEQRVLARRSGKGRRCERWGQSLALHRSDSRFCSTRGRVAAWRASQWLTDAEAVIAAAKGAGYRLALSHNESGGAVDLSRSKGGVRLSNVAREASVSARHASRAAPRSVRSSTPVEKAADWR